MKTLIIFAKAPVAGQVKTRLTKNTPLDAAEVCRLYEGFLKDTIISSAMTDAKNIAIHFTPADEEPMMKKIVTSLRLGVRNENRFVFTPQEGKSFTERVENAFRAEAAGGSELVMIGADSPMIRPDVIDEAFEFVYARSGMALGPSGEGGLYLIGYPADVSFDYNEVFTHGSELENMTAIAERLAMPVRLLPGALDVDVEADLVTLLGMVRALDYERRFEGSLFPSHTHKALKKLELEVVRSSGDTRAKRLARL
ncbi:hypothetical protein MNBD_NITROSPINAE02-1318 [hydrothermal vent metagenome]|uniref:Glycosyltransferase n=1 Tax=hydrothermal vent metagenome TaxID=652676 RepID=A0A3B1BRB1_9ZZZZ